MSIEFILLVSIIISLLSWSLVMYWYIHPLLEKYPVSKAMEPLLLFHSFRYIGLMFLIPGVTSEVLDPRFATPAAYGDLLSAFLALAAVASLRLNIRWAMSVVWIFNIWGTFDLLNAVIRGVMYIPNGHFGAAYWIPALVVPALLVTHVYLFKLLLNSSFTKAPILE